MVDLTSVILAPRSSLCEMGVGNLPAVAFLVKPKIHRSRLPTFRQPRAQKTGDLLDECIRRHKSIIFPRQLLDQLLVLVQLLQIIRAHRIYPKVLGPVNVMLVPKNTDGHVGTRYFRQLDSAGETLVALRVIVLEADLELHSLKEIALLFVEGVVEKGLHVGAHSGYINSG